MTEVRLVDVRKEYGPGNTAVRGVSLDMRENEFTVLLGPSGCGKSTTLRMIAGLETASSGEICIGGRVVNDLEPKDRDVAMVFQDYALYPHMNVARNMSFSLRLAKFPSSEINKRVSAAAKIQFVSLRKLPFRLFANSIPPPHSTRRRHSFANTQIHKLMCAFPSTESVPFPCESFAVVRR